MAPSSSSAPSPSLESSSSSSRARATQSRIPWVLLDHRPRVAGPDAEVSGGGDAAPTPRESGLPPRPNAAAGRPPMPLAEKPVVERHRDAEDSPREHDATTKEEEEPPVAVAVRPRSAPRERSQEGGQMGQRSAATALGGRGRRGRHYDDADYLHGWEAGALVVRPRGARREFPEAGKGSEAGAAGHPSTETALGATGRLARHHKSEPPSRESGALVVHERPEGCGTTAAGQGRSPAAAHLGRHHGGLVNPRDREPRRADDVPPHRRGEACPGASKSGKEREKADDVAPRRTPAKGGRKGSTGAAVEGEASADSATNGGGTQPLGDSEAADAASAKPESSDAAAAASRHPRRAQGKENMADMEAAVQGNAPDSEMIQSILTDLVQNKGILDVELVESWLMEKESHSTVSYFEINASPAQRSWYNKWASYIPQYTGNSAGVRNEIITFKDSCCAEVPKADLDEIWSKIQHQNIRCNFSDLVKGRFKAMLSLREFLCRSCLDPAPSLEFSALTMLLAAAKTRNNLHVLGSKVQIIGIALVKAFIGRPDIQSQSLKLLSKLCGLHLNTKKILECGGFRCAVEAMNSSALVAETAAHLLSILLQTECSYPSIFKDNLPYHLVKAVGLGKLKNESAIESIILAGSQVDLALSGFIDALVILNSGTRSKNLLLAILSRAITGQSEED